MKAEQRHQLHTNALADHLGRFLQGMKSSHGATSPLIWVFIVLTVGTFVVWQYFGYAAQVDASTKWVEVDAAQQDPLLGSGRLSRLYDEAPNTIAGRTAGFDFPRLSIQHGQAKLNSSQRAEGIIYLKSARDLYERLSKQCADSPVLAQEALMGVATASESLVGTNGPDKIKEDLERAIEDYKKLVAAFPESFLGKQAAQRVALLAEKLPEVTKFYEEFTSLTAAKGAKESKPLDSPELKLPESKGP
ncbi:MAG TPA: hypothetical protein VK395_23485 [Gemmataceae bacterium]|nr:hypothetical protein [Gemmataceae bacterium]